MFELSRKPVVKLGYLDEDFESLGPQLEEITFALLVKQIVVGDLRIRIIWVYFQSTLDRLLEVEHEVRDNL